MKVGEFIIIVQSTWVFLIHLNLELFWILKKLNSKKSKDELNTLYKDVD